MCILDANASMQQDTALTLTKSASCIAFGDQLQLQDYVFPLQTENISTTPALIKS